MKEHIYNIEPDIINLEGLSFNDFYNKKKENPSYFQSQLEVKLKNYLKTDKELCVLNSGTSALHLALLLSGAKKGDVIFCSNSTFIASATPILYIGAEPYLVDIEMKTGGMNPIYLEKAILNCIKQKRNPKAIIVTHSYGVPSMMLELQELKKKYNLILIEDAAEALGSLYKGLNCGILGDFGVFSFNTNKLSTTFGGGVLIVNNIKEKERVKRLSSQSKVEGVEYIHTELGYNYRMNDLAAYLGSYQLNYLKDELKKKRDIFFWYKEAIKNINGISLLFEEERGSTIPNRWMNCIRFSNRFQKESAQSLFLQNKIEVRGLWYPLNMQEFLKKHLYEGFNESCDLNISSLCLPSGVNLEKQDIERIVKILQRA